MTGAGAGANAVFGETVGFVPMAGAEAGAGAKAVFGETVGILTMTGAGDGAVFGEDVGFVTSTVTLYTEKPLGLSL